MSKPKFSVVLIGRNEEKTIPRLLQSLAAFRTRGGDIVFVDTGSKDKTAEVARSGGCRVYEEGDRFRYVIDDEKAKAINDRFVVANEVQLINGGDSFFAFDQARNYAMSLAVNDFICTPDCDEAWTTLDIDRINALIDDGYEKLFVAFVFSHNPDGTPSLEFAADTRLYDRRRISWKGIIHETMQHKGALKMTTLPRDAALLEHFQNVETNRAGYLAGLAWACYEEPANDRNSHYFARELMYKGYYRSAIREFMRHIDMNGWADERGQSMVYVGNCHDALGDGTQALAWWHKAFDLTGTRREPLIALAHFSKRRDKFQAVAAYAAAAMEIPHNGFYNNMVSTYTYEPFSLMYWAKGWMGDIAAARKNWLRCWEYQPNDPTFIRDFEYYFEKPKVSIVIPSVRPDKLKVCVQAIVENAGYKNYEIIVEEDDHDNPQGAPKVLKRGVERSTGELVLMLGDDNVPQKNFLFHAVAAMHFHFPNMDGMIGLNDMKTNGATGATAAMWLISKKLLPMLGGEFLHTGYHHLYSDNELTARCRQAGKYAWCEAAKIYHDHPWEHGWSAESYDKFYKKAYEEQEQHDRELLAKRASELGFYGW